LRQAGSTLSASCSVFHSLEVMNISSLVGPEEILAQHD
jgi:hypothetical protein